ncbi:hypothetical protein IMG5_026990, partial [Ichthyophthirius multifiliis]
KILIEKINANKLIFNFLIYNNINFCSFRCSCFRFHPLMHTISKIATKANSYVNANTLYVNCRLNFYFGCHAAFQPDTSPLPATAMMMPLIIAQCNFHAMLVLLILTECVNYTANYYFIDAAEGQLYVQLFKQQKWFYGDINTFATQYNVKCYDMI